MRWLTVPLYNAQKADSGTPFVQVVCVGPGAAYYWNTTNRVVSVTQQEEPFGGQCSVRLLNNDHFFSGMDLRGYRLGVGWGYHTADGDEVSWAPGLYVLDQQDLSQEGDLITELLCIDIWQKLALNSIGPDPAGGVGLAPAWGNPEKLAIATKQFEGVYDTSGGWLTIRQIINSLITGIDPPIDTIYGLGDALFNEYKPTYFTEIGYPIKSIISNLLEMTRSVLRVRSSPEHYIQLHAIDLGVETGIEYTYDSDHAFFVNVRGRSLTIPNIVYYSDIEPGRGPNNFLGVFSDWASVAAFGKIPVIKWDISISSNEEGNQRAEATIRRLMEEVNQGAVIAPMNCGQELFDWVEVEDSRIGLHTTGRVGGITRTYDSGRYAKTTRSYTIELRLGGISSEVVTTTPDANLRSAEGMPYYSKPSNTNWPGQPLTNTTGLRGMLPFFSNLIILPGKNDGTLQDSWCHWANSQIIWGDGFIQNIHADENPLYVDVCYAFWDLASADPSQVYFALTFAECVGPSRGILAVVKRGQGGSPIGIIGQNIPQITVVTEDIVIGAITSAKIANGAVVNSKVAQYAIDSGNLKNLAVTTAKMADAIVTHDKMAPQAINHEDIRVGAIYGDVVAAGAIATNHLAVGAVSADKIAANAVVADKIAANTILSSHIAANQIVAGHIAVQQISGFHIMANNIVGGHIQAGTITADKISCTALSAITANLGTITAGKIYLSSSFQFCNAYGTELVKMYASSNLFVIDAKNLGYGMSLWHNGWFEVKVNDLNRIVIDDDGSNHPIIRPGLNEYGSLGSAGSSWWDYVIGHTGFFRHVYYHDLIYVPDDRDDLAILSNIKPVKGKLEVDLGTLPPEVYHNITGAEGRLQYDKDGKPIKAIHAGAMQGLLLGSIKQLLAKVEGLEAEVEALKEAK